MNFKISKRSVVLTLGVGLFLVVSLELLQLSGETTALTSSLANLIFHNNFHEVVPGKFYRSAEMDSVELKEVLEKYRIKTVIDLRLGMKKSGEEERELVNLEGAKFFHVAMQGSRIPPISKIEELLKVYDNAETPILVHCSSGTHRSGVASSIWLLDKENSSAEEAMKQLSSKYGFFRWERDLKSFWQGQLTIDNLIWQYAKARKARKISFREWLASAEENLESERRAKLLAPEENVKAE